MSNSSFSPRSFGFAGFVGATAVAGVGVSAAIAGVHAANRTIRDQAQRARVTQIIRRQREDAREMRKDLAISRAESAIRLWHINKLPPASRAVR